MKSLIFNTKDVLAWKEGSKKLHFVKMRKQPEPDTDCPYHVGVGKDRKARVLPYQPGDKVYIRENFLPGYLFEQCDEGEVDEEIYGEVDRIEITYCADHTTVVVSAPLGTAWKYQHKYGDEDGPDLVRPLLSPEWATTIRTL